MISVYTNNLVFTTKIYTGNLDYTTKQNDIQTDKETKKQTDIQTDPTESNSTAKEVSKSAGTYRQATAAAAAAGRTHTGTNL